MKNRIVLAREYAKLSQKELAEKLGISPSTLNGYEKGNHDPKSTGLIKIAKICNVSTDYLLGLSNEISQLNDISTSQNSRKIDELLSKAKSLNSEGLERLIGYTDDLVSSGKYEKPTINERAV